MPSHGLLGVVGQINPIERHGDPIGDVREVASMESRDRVESLGGFEIAATQEKDQLIARRAAGSWRCPGAAWESRSSVCVRRY
jgi:hypothetical protein